MALLQPTVFRGIPVKAAYYKITGISFREAGTKNGETGEKDYAVMIFVNSYSDTTKSGDLEQVVYHRTCTESEISIASCYEYLKTLPDFEKAVDA